MCDYVGGGGEEERAVGTSVYVCWPGAAEDGYYLAILGPG